MEVYNLDNLKFAFDLLDNCKDIREDSEYHPEKCVLSHSMQVLELAFKESDDIDLILSAMLHDIGKAIYTIDHDNIGIELLKDYVSVKTLWLIEHHMRIWYFLEGKMKKLSKVQYLSQHPWLSDLILLARWDKSGRNPNITVEYNKERIIERLNLCVNKHFKNNT